MNMNDGKYTADIGVVIVTFNRLEKLIKTLKAYEDQTLAPAYIVVVNNASSDGTAAYLEKWAGKKERFKKYILNLPKNIGGSGGFHVGEEKALSLDAQWVMIADDDAYPECDYIEGMQTYINEHDTSNVSVVCGKVLQQGSFLNAHRCRMKSPWYISFAKKLSEKDYKKEAVEFQFASYVGCVISVDKMRKAGLVTGEYFIWYDDFEHSLRLSKFGRLILIPKFTIIHDCDAEHVKVSWKSYYGWRNLIDMYKRHFKLQFLFIVALFFCKTCLLPLKGNRWAEMKLRFTAIKDGILGNLGINDKYRPGLKL